MTDKKETAPEGAAAKTPTTTEGNSIVRLDDYTVKYDLPAINAFLDAVFHADHSHVYCQISKRAPRGFGNERSRILTTRLSRSEAPMAAYYSTASLDYTDGMLRHTKMAFKSYHVFVADDVGTKIPFTQFPESMAENYRLESSPGNYQLGFILAEPITDYDEAQAFINLMVDAGYTDAGGAMPCKKVRLPCGVNNKKGPNQFFPVNLHFIEGEPWGIQELLNAAKIDVNWEEYRKTIHDQTRRTKRLGASAWSPDLFYVDPHTGVYDPLLEWLYDQNMVVEDGATNYFEILCPFHDMHTGTSLEESLCGYSPLGHGMLPHKRIFHCFHSHAKEHTHVDYIEQLHAMGAPLVPASEFAPQDMMKYVYDSGNDRVFDITADYLIPFRVESINRITQEVFLPTRNGVRAVKPLPLWLKQPSAVKVNGAIADASNPDRIVKFNGVPHVNLASRPTYPSLNIDEDHVAKFVDFIDYLIPDDVERNYFLDWLACKVKNPAFRGAGIVLISQTQGVGKNVMFTMLQKMFGEVNAHLVSMETLIHPSSNFNEHIGALFCCVSETMAVDDPKTINRAYNKLKEVVDPAAQWQMVNQKYGVKFQARTATSYLFFSNNTNAVALQRGDRRFFAMSGPSKVRDSKYFADLCAWRDKGEWCPHVWNWLLARDIEEHDMYKKAPVTQTMEIMNEQNTSMMEHVVRAAIDVWPSPLVPFKPIQELLVKYVPYGLPEEAPKRNQWAQRLYRRYTKSYTGRNRIKQMRHAVKLEHADILDTEGEIDAALAASAAYLDAFDEHDYKAAVDEILSDHIDLI